MDIPSKETREGYEELMTVMFARRSIREFDDREVEQEKIDKILSSKHGTYGNSTFRCSSPGYKWKKESERIFR